MRNERYEKQEVVRRAHLVVGRSRDALAVHSHPAHGSLEEVGEEEEQNEEEEEAEEEAEEEEKNEEEEKEEKKNDENEEVEKKK